MHVCELCDELCCCDLDDIEFPQPSTCLHFEIHYQDGEEQYEPATYEEN